MDDNDPLNYKTIVPWISPAVSWTYREPMHDDRVSMHDDCAPMHDEQWKLAPANWIGPNNIYIYIEVLFWSLFLKLIYNDTNVL